VQSSVARRGSSLGRFSKATEMLSEGLRIRWFPSNPVHRPTLGAARGGYAFRGL
jgi:hypothetical protein